jgi:hypothetical protein
MRSAYDIIPAPAFKLTLTRPAPPQQLSRTHRLATGSDETPANLSLMASDTALHSCNHDLAGRFVEAAAH